MVTLNEVLAPYTRDIHFLTFLNNIPNSTLRVAQNALSGLVICFLLGVKMVG